MIKLIILAFLAISALGKEIPKDSLYEINTRIVGGKPAKPGQFPYMVSLRNYHQNKHFCGGILANSRWVVSAAHCTTAMRASFIVAGTIYRTKEGYRYKIARTFNHPKYDKFTITNDISLLQTKQPITFTQYIYPIALSSSYVGGGVSAKVIGWGVTSSGHLADNLQYLDVKTITNAECSNEIRRNVSNHKICHEGVKGFGPCFGDSGGPMATKNAVIGIASYIVNKCASGFPSVYERISFHRNWISRTFQMS